MRASTRVLAYQIGSLGDTIVTIPALRAVRRHFGPHAHITLLHEVRTGLVTTPGQVLDGLGLVNEFLPYKIHAQPIQSYLSAAALIIRLKARRFDAVIYLAPSERSVSRVRRDAFFFRISGISHRIGFGEFPPLALHPVDAKGLPASVPHEAWFRLERLRRDGIDISVESDLSKPFLSLPQRFIDQTEQWLSVHRASPQLPLVAICPGCKQPANVWPIERFIEVGRRLVQQGDVELVVVGGPAEREMGQRMVEVWGAGLNAAGVFPPLGSAALLAKCAFMVGVDTGTTHLAAAQGVPCVALYGCREEPGRFYPLGDGHIVLRHSVPCAGCRLIMQPCPVNEHPCMTGITVEMVWQAVQAMAHNFGT